MRGGVQESKGERGQKGEKEQTLSEGQGLATMSRCRKLSQRWAAVEEKTKSSEKGEGTPISI
jgi:hypothetical protein